MKKLLSLVLALVFIMSCMFTMSSCDILDFLNEDTTDTNKNNNNSTTDIVEDPTDEPDEEFLEIISNGKTEYTIVYPDNSSTDAYSSVLDLVDAITEVTGVTMKYVKASEALKRPDDKYILIGSTTFAESHEAINNLGSSNLDAYSIHQAGDNIVFGARFEEGVIAAINYYTSNMLKDNYDAKTQTLVLEEYSRKGKIYGLESFDVENLSNYVIIYSDKVDGFKDAATEIKSYIASVTGYSLSVRKDSTTPETECEILVGNTNRHTSYECYKDGTRLMEYKMVVKGAQLQIVCGGPFSAKAGANMLVDTYFKNTNTSLDEGTYLEANLATESIAKKEGTDIRLMTANLLAHSSTSTAAGFPHPNERIEIFAKVLVDYAPDIIGVQETDSYFQIPMQYYFNIIKETYGIEYSATQTKLNGNYVANFVIYRSDKYKLDYQNVELPSYANTNSSLYHSVLTSAKFTSKEDPTIEVALLSAHWHWETEDKVVGTAKQYVDAQQMAAAYKKLQGMYPNAKIFCTGDFNSHRFKNQYFNQLLSDINGVVASSIAEKNGVLIPSFQHYTPKQYIDHIIGLAGTFDVLYHAGTNNYSSKLTDHQPVYADIKFIK